MNTSPGKRRQGGKRTKALKRLEARIRGYEAIRDKQGYKKPGSMQF